jgi:hypothetical protein
MLGWLKKAFGSGGQAPRHPVPVSELAQLLVDEYVRKIVVNPLEDRQLDATTAALYEAKTRIYQLASLLIALRGEEKKEAAYATVREFVERAVYAPLPQGLAFNHTVVGKAAQNLNDDLLLPAALGKHTAIRWALAWLDEVVVDEWKWNPVTCGLIGMNWLNYHIMVVDVLRSLQPIA